MNAKSAATLRIALLRAINVGGTGLITMAALREIFVDLGMADVRTLLQTGNVIFRSKASGARLETALEAGLEDALGWRSDLMVRTVADWDAIIGSNPFPKEAKQDPARLIVMFCKTAPGKDMKVTGAKDERFKVVGREIYIYYPSGMGNSRLKLHAVGTARNFNTVRKIESSLRGT